MLVPLTAPAQISAFSTACSYEHVFGSRALTALRAYGLGDVRARFYLCVEDGLPAAALHLSGGVLSVSADGRANPREIAALVRAEHVGEIDADRPLTDALQRLLGGCISRFLTGRIQETGKTPRLISGYNDVAELYRRVGFETCGHWGELYL